MLWGGHWGPIEALWGDVGGGLGRSGDPLGIDWGALGGHWGSIDALWGDAGGRLGRSWGSFGVD